ncbi:hypothetical protein VIN30_08675 [Adlercreutzia sp. R7]|uniref:Rhomboid family intramembrane serine protease n=1 Tax=Adlercreutzia wanghongyangiae TaxID=3111451 RepID=A0ABU6IJB6_9ACTN|nr:hypothetical protein [Adlercreutzia sp. R7]
MRNTTDDATPESLAATVRRHQNLQILGTFAGLVALWLLLNLTPVPLWVCEQFGLSPNTPASLLGRAYWNDCFGGPLGNAVAGPLPRPEDLSYAPEADQFLAELENFAVREEAAEEAAPTEGDPVGGEPQ